MNTDKIYAESIVNEYAPKDTSKVVALKKLDTKAKAPANIFGYTFGIIESNWRWKYINDGIRYYHWHYWYGYGRI